MRGTPIHAGNSRYSLPPNFPKEYALKVPVKTNNNSMACTHAIVSEYNFFPVYSLMKKYIPPEAAVKIQDMTILTCNGLILEKGKVFRIHSGKIY